MRKILFIISTVMATFAITASAQTAKKPTLMIVPSDNWCAQRYFTQTFQNQGQEVRISDYKTAFQEDSELGGVVSKLGELLTGLGYSLKDCEQELKAIEMRTAEDNVTMSNTSGAMLVESPIDQLKRHAKSDIIIQIGWQVHNEGSGKSVSFILEAFDAYTSKRIATSSANNESSSLSVPKILEAAANKQITAFDEQLTQYFNNLQRDGREIILTIRCWDSWGNNLETEFGDDELLDCIDNWIHQNTVNGAYNLTDNSDTWAQFEQVRIPLFDDKGKAMDARAFATSLRKYLQKEYQITSKVMVRGLGEAIIVLGEK